MADRAPAGRPARRHLPPPGKRSLLEANEAVQKLLFKAQVDRNEVTGEQDPTVRLIDFDNPERNCFHAINQFRVDTPGRVRPFIIPDIVLFVNGLPLVVIEAKIGSATTADPMHEAFTQLARYRDAREETRAAGLREGEPRLFYPNLLLIRTCGEAADFGTISSGPEHFYAWKNIWPEQYAAIAPPLGDGACAGGAGPGPAQPAGAARRAAHLHRLHGPAQRQAGQGRRPLPAAPCRAPDRGTPAQGQDADAERSGVVWHTQGSGKSLTMVFVGRMLRASRDLKDIKI